MPAPMGLLPPLPSLSSPYPALPRAGLDPPVRDRLSYAFDREGGLMGARRKLLRRSFLPKVVAAEVREGGGVVPPSMPLRHVFERAFIDGNL